jgi:predicted TIM-barrel fold metal-dependent hydrolase
VKFETTKLRDLRDVARYPWFEVAGDRIKLLGDEARVERVIDFHTHLALAYIRKMRVDLQREWERTEHYLPIERPVDLDIYVNKNFTPEDLAKLNHDLVWKSFTAGGMRATHTVPNLAREMQDLRVTTSVLLPIELPAISSNAETYLEAVKGRKDLVSFGSVHPLSRGLERRIDRQRALGAKGLKLHPAIQLVPPDSPRMLKIFEILGDRGMIAFLHCGPVGIEQLKLCRDFTQVKRYEIGIAKFPRTTFVLGHSGGLQMETALELAKAHENVYLELASQSVSNVRRIIEEGPADRIVFGSDWPFYHQAVGITKVLLATEDRPELRRKVLYENAARLLGIGVAREAALVR